MGFLVFESPTKIKLMIFQLILLFIFVNHPTFDSKIHYIIDLRRINNPHLCGFNIFNVTRINTGCFNETICRINELRHPLIFRK